MIALTFVAERIEVVRHKERGHFGVILHEKTAGDGRVAMVVLDNAQTYELANELFTALGRPQVPLTATNREADA